MKLTAFDFTLPERLIAQRPLPLRDQSRMMVVDRRTATCDHRTFRELPEILTRKHFLVLNDTRVFPARLRGGRPGREERIEILLLRQEAPGEWSALLKPARKARAGQDLEVGPLRARVVEVRDDGSRLLRFSRQEDLLAVFEKIGEPPLPPYIRRKTGEDLAQDRLRYQTIYSKHTGSIAAPTAGLHFTPAVLRRLTARGVQRCRILLHVGYGTFQPVRSVDIENHRLVPEYCKISDSTASRIRQLKARGSGLVAVGTTTARALEYWVRQRSFPAGGYSGYCDLYITPGFEFRVLDGLLTNFHLPRSTLFMLVCAFAGRELMLECYREAISKEYRFFSYGDCMLIL